MNARIQRPRVVFAIFGLLCMAASGGSPAIAQVGTNDVQIGDTLVSLESVGGDIRTVAVQGDYAFTGEGAELAVIDLSDPQNPTRVAGVPIPWIGRDLTIQSGNAFLAGDGGLLIVDVQDPLDPVLLGSYTTTAAATNLSVVGDHVYLALGEEGLEIVNASDPSLPVQAGVYPGPLNDAWAAGNRAFLAGEDLRILDVSDPANPALLGTYDAGGPFQAVHSDGSLVYLAGGSDLLIVDASDPSSPSLLGSETLATIVHDVRAAGDTAYFLAVEWDILGSSNYCQAGAVDVSDPGDPSVLGRVFSQISPPESCGGHLQPAGDRLYAADGVLQIVDLADPSDPDLLGTYVTLRPAGLFAQGRFVYVADKTLDMAILETGEPFSISQASSLPLDGWAEGIEPAGPYALVWSDLPAHPHFPAGRLHTTDVSDPGGPVLASSSSVTGIVDLSAAGDTLYMVDGRAGFSPHLEIIDFSNPAFPALAGEYGSTFEKAEAVFGVGDIAYLVASDYPGGENRQLHVLDTSDPAFIVHMGSFPVGFAHELVVENDLAYLALGEAGLQVIDVSDPAHMDSIITYPLSGGAWDVQLVASVAYVAGGSAGVQVIDFFNPFVPIPVASQETFEDSMKVAVSRDLVYSLGLEAGLEILRLVTRTTAEIGSAGGSLVSLPDRTTYVLPAGAFVEDVTVTHDTRDEAGLPDTGKMIGIRHAFENAACSSTGEPLQPLAAYSLTIQYTSPEKGPAIESTLGLYTWDGGAWVLEPSAVVDTANNTITATADRFGLWAVLGETNWLYFPLVGGS